jgi:predicted dehydrogenase
VTQGYRQLLVGAGAPLPDRRPADGPPRRWLRQNDLFAFQARAFLEQVAGIQRLPPCPSFEEGLRNVRLLEAVVASAKPGGDAPIDPPLDGRDRPA